MPIRKLKESDKNWIDTKPCLHREHEPPRHIVIKPGEPLEHECPACKKITILRPTEITC